MGWTSYHAEHYKKGKIDRVAEVEERLKWSEDAPHTYTILKSSLVGRVVYSAIERICKETGDRSVFATIFLTSTNEKDFYNFSYKDMDESVGPCYYDCPKYILDLLTPTTYEYAIAWRKACYETIEKKKLERRNPMSLGNLPVGTKIKLLSEEKGDIILKKSNCFPHKNPIWVDWCKHIRYPVKHIKYYGYEVVA